MKKSILLMILVSGCGMSKAQHTQVILRPAARGEGISFNIQEPRVTIDGYDGEDIVVELLPKTAAKMPAEAAGMVAFRLAGRSMETNILKPDFKELENHEVQVVLPACNCDGLLVKVPRGRALVIRSMITNRNAKLTVNNIDNEVQMLGSMPALELNHVAGFLVSMISDVLNSTYSITLNDIQWSNVPVTYNGKSRRLDYAIHTTGGSVNLHVPQSLAATFSTYTKQGKVFTELPLVQVPARNPEYKKNLSYFTTYNGSTYLPELFVLNRGGLDIALSSYAGNFYLLKQK